MAIKNPTKLWASLAAAFVLQAGWQTVAVHDKWAKDYCPKGNLVSGTGLSPDQFLFALAGFREMIAGILWVRADSFFDTGQYDAVLPIIRLVTILDPKQIDVYATGMWHIGYNFTDEDQRSDRRYLPAALALGKEGVKNNPNTYDLYFETGWIWYHKIKDDYDYAVKYFEQAEKQPDMIAARKNLLPKAYLRTNQVEKAIEKYQDLLKDAETAYKEDDAFGNRQNRDTIEGNLDTEIVRGAQRGYFAKKDGSYDKGEYDTKPPFDVNMSIKLEVVEPNVIKIQGTWGVLPVGCRLVGILRDKDYPNGKPAGMDWDFLNSVNLDPPAGLTFLVDDIFIKNRRFAKTIDMSKDPTMYPLTKKEVVFEWYYNPRIAPAHIQDKFGYDGSGMTDKQFLNTEIRPGQRVIYGKFDLTTDMIKRRGEWRDRVPVFKTSNFVDANATKTDDVVIVPSMRTNTGGASK